MANFRCGLFFPVLQHYLNCKLCVSLLGQRPVSYLPFPSYLIFLSLLHVSYYVWLFSPLRTSVFPSFLLASSFISCFSAFLSFSSYALMSSSIPSFPLSSANMHWLLPTFLSSLFPFPSKLCLGSSLYSFLLSISYRQPLHLSSFLHSFFLSPSFRQPLRLSSFLHSSLLSPSFRQQLSFSEAERQR